MKLLQVVTAGVLLATMCVAGGASADVTAGNLRCECRKDPLGIDVGKPRLSWVMDTGGHDAGSALANPGQPGAALTGMAEGNTGVRGLKQSAYQVLLASTSELLAKDQGDLWDSGKVDSDQCIAVRYAGAPLVSETNYYWKVRVWLGRSDPGAGNGKDDHAMAWSAPAGFLTGKMRPDDWRGKWIGPDLAPRATVADGPVSTKPAHQHGAIYLRKDFELANPVVRAVLSFSGLGFSEVAIGWRSRRRLSQ